MLIFFLDQDLAQLCQENRIAQRKLGAEGAKKLRRRLDDLDAAPSLDVMRTLPGRCHELKGDRAGELALDLAGGSRLLFRPEHDPIPAKPDGGLDWAQVTSITITWVGDYHD